MSTEPALRVIMRRLRDIMAAPVDLAVPADGQQRLDMIVRQIAGVMVADVCSLYLRRQDGSLELYASEGLNPTAVHATMLKRGEGLVGRCAEMAAPINERDASKHPAFSYRPETGEEVYHSLLAVPIQRSGQVLGVLVVQNRTVKEYSDEDVEVMQATAMVVAEHLVSGAVSSPIEIQRSLQKVVIGEPISEGIALGHVMLHEPRIVVTKLMADDPAFEMRKLEEALHDLKTSLDEMLSHELLSGAGDHRDVLEAYRMFAHDRGWERRLREAVQSGLTAGAAVERVKNGTRARMLKQADPFWRERQRDLEDLSDRLLRILVGVPVGYINPPEMPLDTILVARNMGPAELIDYDRNTAARARHRGRQRAEPRRDRRQGAGNPGRRAGGRHRRACDGGRCDHRRWRDRRSPRAPVPGRGLGLHGQGAVPGATAEAICRAARPAGRYDRRRGHNAAYQCRFAGRYAPPQGIGRRRCRPVPH